MSRRARYAAIAAAVLAAYGAGAATGVLSSSSAPAARPHERGIIDQAEHTIQTQSAKPAPAAVLQRAAIDGMLRALGDQWASYYTPSDYAQFRRVLSGAYTGVGVWIRRSDGALRVTSVEPASPAAAAGVRRGDVLLAVGGATVVGHTVAEVVGDLRGKPGTDVTVEVLRGDDTVTARLRRAAINDDDVRESMLTPQVELLRVAAFTQGVGRWIRTKVAAAAREHLHGIVLDLRDDPGGLLDEAVETASAFFDGGPVASYVHRGEAPEVLDALGHGNTSIPVAVLVNGGTASAAEIVAGALQDRHRAVIVGSRTFGKGSVQQPDQLSDGSALELTVGHYLTPSGRSLDGVGITPDIAVPVGTAATVVEQRALEALSGLSADTGSTGRG